MKKKVLFLTRDGEGMRVGMNWGLDTDLHELGEDLKYYNKLLMGSQEGPGYNIESRVLNLSSIQ